MMSDTQEFAFIGKFAKQWMIQQTYCFVLLLSKQEIAGRLQYNMLFRDVYHIKQM